MAFEPKISVCYHNCNEVEITDITGVYNVDSNATAWNTPNPASSDATKIELVIDGVIYDVTDDAPGEINGEFTYTIADLVLADGYHTFEYKVYYTEGVGVEAVTTNTSYTLTEFITCAARCCVDKMWLRVADNHCNCDKGDLMQKAIEAEALLKAAQTSAAACGNETQANLLLDSVTNLCAFEECNCN